jgi:hypothetical protein
VEWTVSATLPSCTVGLLGLFSSLVVTTAMRLLIEVEETFDESLPAMGINEDCFGEMGLSSAVKVVVSSAVVSLMMSMSKSISSSMIADEERRTNVEVVLKITSVLGVMGPSSVLMVLAENVGVSDIPDEAAESRWDEGYS